MTFWFDKSFLQAMESNSRHFKRVFMTFWFDKSLLQAMESNSQMFNKPLVIVLLQQSI